MLTVASLRQRFYPDIVSREPVVRFVRELERVVRPNHNVLDIGAGAGELNAYALKGRVRRLVGVDVDGRVSGNPLLDLGVPADICALPFQDGCFDVAFSIYVLEHVDRPDVLAAEIYRVLRPGGICMALTPNVFHYVTGVSRLTPLAFHRWVNEKRGRSADDTFPTRYKLNSRAALLRVFGAAGFDAMSIDAIEVEPKYLTANVCSYVLGVAYERMVNAVDLLEPFRVNLLATFKKPAARPN